MEERRRFVRLDARIGVRYAVLPEGTLQPAVSKELGGGGVCFLADRVIPPGTRLQLALALPTRESPVNAIAEVVWSESSDVIDKQEHRHLAEIGVRFLELSPQDSQTLLAYIASNLKSSSA